MHHTNLILRIARKSDLDQLQALFVETIKTICQKDYTPDQIQAWISSVKNTERWQEKIEKQFFLVAKKETVIVGYASLECDDHLDLLYVHKDFQRQGIANRLYEELETEAKIRGVDNLRADVSITAIPFFKSKGFIIQSEKKQIIQDVEITNYKMIKALNQAV